VVIIQNSINSDLTAESTISHDQKDPMNCKVHRYEPCKLSSATPESSNIVQNFFIGRPKTIIAAKRQILVEILPLEIGS